MNYNIEELKIDPCECGSICVYPQDRKNGSFRLLCTKCKSHSSDYKDAYEMVSAWNNGARWSGDKCKNGLEPICKSVLQGVYKNGDRLVKNEVELLFYAGKYGAPEGYIWLNDAQAYVSDSDERQCYELNKWNPLVSNDEAFKLAVDCDLCFISERKEFGLAVSVYDDNKNGRSLGGRWTSVYYHDCANDKHYATRLAIVRAAAIIGGIKYDY